MPDEPIKNETTNMVLATKLDSFKELVDNKFKNVEQTLDRIEKNNFLTVTEYNLKHNELESRIKVMETTQSENKGKLSGVHVIWMAFTAILMIGLAVFNTFFKGN